MDEVVGVSGFGTPDAVDAALADYFPAGVGLWNNQTDMLLYALLLEQQADRYQGGGPVDVSAYLEQQYQQIETGQSNGLGATYASVELDGSDLGERYHEIDLDFTAQEVDLRGFGAEVHVQFGPSVSSPNGVVKYQSGDAPVTGIPVNTSVIKVRDPTDSITGMTVDCWGDR